MADFDAPLTEADQKWPYWPTNQVNSACREAGINAVNLEGGYGGDCVHFCNYIDADHIYDPDNLDNNTNAYCIDGYDFYEKFVLSWTVDNITYDACQTLCVPAGEPLKYVSRTPVHHMYMLRDAWSNTEYTSEYAQDSSFWTDEYK